MTLRPDNNLCCCSNPFKAIAEAKRKRKTNLEPVTRNFHFQLELAIFLSSPTHRRNYEGLQWACHESQYIEGLQTHHPQEGVSGKRRCEEAMIHFQLFKVRANNFRSSCLKEIGN